MEICWNFFKYNLCLQNQDVVGYLAIYLISLVVKLSRLSRKARGKWACKDWFICFVYENVFLIFHVKHIKPTKEVRSATEHHKFAVLSCFQDCAREVRHLTQSRSWSFSYIYKPYVQATWRGCLPSLLIGSRWNIGRYFIVENASPCNMFLLRK